MRLLRLNYYLVKLWGSDCFFVLGLCSIMLWSPKLSLTNISVTNLLLYLTSNLWVLCCVTTSTVLACVEGRDGWAVQELHTLGYTPDFLLVTNLQKLPAAKHNPHPASAQPPKMYFHGKKFHARIFVKWETEWLFRWALTPELSTTTRLKTSKCTQPFSYTLCHVLFLTFPLRDGSTSEEKIIQLIWSLEAPTKGKNNNSAAALLICIENSGSFFCWPY